MLALALLLLSAPGSTPPNAPATPVKTAADLDKVRCRTFPVTGSLVQTTRECHTIRQWRDLEDRAQDDVHTMTTPTGAFQQPN